MVESPLDCSLRLILSALVTSIPTTASSVRPSSHGEVLCVENQRGHHVFEQDWRKRNLSLYSTNPLCFHEIKDKFEGSRT